MRGSVVIVLCLVTLSTGASAGGNQCVRSLGAAQRFNVFARQFTGANSSVGGQAAGQYMELDNYSVAGDGRCAAVNEHDVVAKWLRWHGGEVGVNGEGSGIVEQGLDTDVAGIQGYMGTAASGVDWDETIRVLAEASESLCYADDVGATWRKMEWGAAYQVYVKPNMAWSLANVHLASANVQQIETQAAAGSEDGVLIVNLHAPGQLIHFRNGMTQHWLPNYQQANEARATRVLFNMCFDDTDADSFVRIHHFGVFGSLLAPDSVIRSNGRVTGQVMGHTVTGISSDKDKMRFGSVACAAFSGDLCPPEAKKTVVFEEEPSDSLAGSVDDAEDGVSAAVVGASIGAVVGVAAVLLAIGMFRHRGQRQRRGTIDKVEVRPRVSIEC